MCGESPDFPWCFAEAAWTGRRAGSSATVRIVIHGSLSYPNGPRASAIRKVCQRLPAHLQDAFGFVFFRRLGAAGSARPLVHVLDGRCVCLDEARRAGRVELVCGDLSVAVAVDHGKVDDVGHGRVL
jgi:hypothetical protein